MRLQLLFQRYEGELFALVLWIDAEGQRDAVPVHEQPHLHDGQGAVLLADAELLVVFSLLDLKIEVRAVIIDELCPALLYGHGVPEQAGLFTVVLSNSPIVWFCPWSVFYLLASVARVREGD